MLRGGVSVVFVVYLVFQSDSYMHNSNFFLNILKLFQAYHLTNINSFYVGRWIFL